MTYLDIECNKKKKEVIEFWEWKFDGLVENRNPGTEKHLVVDNGRVSEGLMKPEKRSFY